MDFPVVGLDDCEYPRDIECVFGVLIPSDGKGLAMRSSKKEVPPRASLLEEVACLDDTAYGDSGRFCTGDSGAIVLLVNNENDGGNFVSGKVGVGNFIADDV